MGVQKNKRSKSRTHKKRSAWSKMGSIQTIACPNCDAVKLPHRICPSCGYYAGREVGSGKVAAAAESK